MKPAKVKLEQWAAGVKGQTNYKCEHCRMLPGTNEVERSRTRIVHLCDGCLSMGTPKEILSMDQLRALPLDRDCSGVYFLWDGDSLQYIGQSMVVGNRLTDHERAYIYGRLRAKPTKRIKFDRATCIALANWTIMELDEQQKLRDRMLITERAYIEAYRPPFNTEWFL